MQSSPLIASGKKMIIKHCFLLLELKLKYNVKSTITFCFSSWEARACKPKGV